jgi:hypothetical protein
MQRIAFVVAALAALAGCNDRSAKKEDTSHPASGTQAGTVGANDTIAPETETPPHSRPTLEPAQGSEWATMPPAPDHHDPDQRGSTLTQQGPLTPQSSAAGQGSATGSMNDSAELDSARSLHLSPSGGDTDRADGGNAGGQQTGGVGGGSSGVAPDEAAPSGSHNAGVAGVHDSSTLGESVDDEAMVRRIHQALVDDETLSHDARTVQINSLDGMIVLTGSVESQRERARIAETAFRESGGRMVIDQIELRQP